MSKKPRRHRRPKRATSPARAAASRSNADHSTGPRTPEGKARSASNGFRHGLRSDRVFLPGESPRLYRGLLASWTPLFDPQTPAEASVARRLVDAIWMWLRVFLVMHGLGFLLAEDIEAAFDQVCALTDPAARIPSESLVERYRSRVTRRFADDLARYTALRSIRLAPALSALLVQSSSRSSRLRGENILPSASPVQASDSGAVLPACVPTPPGSIPSASLVPPRQPLFPLEAISPDGPLDAADFLNSLGWTWAFGFYEAAPEFFPDDYRQLLVSVLAAYKSALPPARYEALASLVQPGSPPPSASVVHPASRHLADNVPLSASLVHADTRLTDAISAAGAPGPLPDPSASLVPAVPSSLPDFNS